jgi:hypothetical protein
MISVASALPAALALQMLRDYVPLDISLARGIVAALGTGPALFLPHHQIKSFLVAYETGKKVNGSCCNFIGQNLKSFYNKLPKGPGPAELPAAQARDRGSGERPKWLILSLMCLFHTCFFMSDLAAVLVEWWPHTRQLQPFTSLTIFCRSAPSIPPGKR